MAKDGGGAQILYLQFKSACRLINNFFFQKSESTSNR